MLWYKVAPALLGEIPHSLPKTSLEIHWHEHQKCWNVAHQSHKSLHHYVLWAATCGSFSDSFCDGKRCFSHFACMQKKVQYTMSIHLILDKLQPSFKKILMCDITSFLKNIQYIQIYILDVFNILETWFKQFKECISNSTSSVIHFVSIWQPVFLWLGVWFSHQVCLIIKRGSWHPEVLLKSALPGASC